jgi:Tfp pilus assembly protein PilF
MVRGDYGGAERSLRRAVVDAPAEPYAHFNLASVLRETGRNDEAVAEYRRAKELFQRVGGAANGEADVGNCLYGIALAEEAKGDPQAAANAWSDYIHFAQRFAGEQPAVAIARDRARTDQQLAHLRGPNIGPQNATRSSTTR